MVRQGDFEISLVQADTKKPFKEHNHCGEIYMEVEPDEEYFIHIHRVGNSFPGPLLATVSVDGKSLGYSMTFRSAEPFPSYLGLRTHTNGTSTYTALKFIKPRVVPSGRQQQQAHSGLIMGKVEVDIFQGFFCGYSMVNNSQLSWQGDQSQVPANAKKCLRSSEGTSSFTSGVYNHLPVEQYRCGRMIGHVRLNYCAALGLIQAGVLPRPSPEVYHRMVNQYSRGARVASYYPNTTASSSSCTSRLLPVITPSRHKTPCGKIEVLYDLTNLDDDE